jgi:hypothetical protein
MEPRERSRQPLAGAVNNPSRAMVDGVIRISRHATSTSKFPKSINAVHVVRRIPHVKIPVFEVASIGRMSRIFCLDESQQVRDVPDVPE